MSKDKNKKEKKEKKTPTPVNANGKGSRNRVSNHMSYRENWERIFGKKKREKK